VEIFSPARARISRPIRFAAALCELLGPRITGPRTSLKMLGGTFIAFVTERMTQNWGSQQVGFPKNSWRGHELDRERFQA
jgi:hypothetical protein